MKLILSRKGFDSAAGKVPSPIFPDGSMLSLPIPDKQSTIAYEDISWTGEKCVGTLVEILTRGKVKPRFKAHLDPDLDPHAIPRAEGWRPVLGQVGAALGHLEKCQVGPGDLFLFFGVFREVEGARAATRYKRSSARQHVLFGWLQVGSKIAVDQAREKLPWVSYHPHLNRKGDGRNTLYVAAERLTLPGVKGGHPGGGLFRRYSELLRLTAPGSRRPGRWLLPSWFHPKGRPSHLTYHSDPSRWSRTNDGVLLRSAAPGQEFVLNCNDYPDAYAWIGNLLNATSTEHEAGS